MNQINLFCNCHSTKLNKRTQFNQKNLLCGSVYESKEYKSSLKDFLFDDIGDNISNLNRSHGELTGLYWVWKHNNNSIVGTNQYRIFWNEEILSRISFNDNTIAVVKSINVNDAVRYRKNLNLNVYDHYSYCHGDAGLILLHGLLEFSNLKLKNCMINELKNTNTLIPYNMFVANKELFDKTCEILFEILDLYYSNFEYLFDSIEKRYNQNRILDFLAERILNVVYLNSEYFYGKHINFVQVPVVDLPHDDV